MFRYIYFIKQAFSFFVFSHVLSLTSYHILIKGIKRICFYYTCRAVKDPSTKLQISLKQIVNMTEEIEERQKPLLMVSESMRNADMYYATRFLSTAPFTYLYLPHGRKDMLIVSQMEYGRAVKESIVNEIRSALDYGWKKT
jgi:hypothetical protein